MDKLRMASKRLSVGSWSPFSSSGDKRASRSPSMASVKRSGDFTDGSDRAAAGAATSHPATANGAANGTDKPGTVPSTSLVELAKIITRESEKLEKYLQESGSPVPSFEVDSPANFPSLPDDMKKAREKIVTATKQLEYLVTGPTEKVRWMAWDVSLLSLDHLIRRC